MVAMRRKDRQESDEEAMAYLKAAEYGVLSTVGPDGEPYRVPLTYAVEEDGKGLVFHCARRLHAGLFWRESTGAFCGGAGNECVARRIFH